MITGSSPHIPSRCRQGSCAFASLEKKQCCFEGKHTFMNFQDTNQWELFVFFSVQFQPSCLEIHRGHLKSWPMKPYRSLSQFLLSTQECFWQPIEHWLLCMHAKYMITWYMILPYVALRCIILHYNSFISYEYRLCTCRRHVPNSDDHLHCFNHINVMTTNSFNRAGVALKQRIWMNEQCIFWGQEFVTVWLKSRAKQGWLMMVCNHGWTY